MHLPSKSARRAGRGSAPLVALTSPLAVAAIAIAWLVIRPAVYNAKYASCVYGSTASATEQLMHFCDGVASNKTWFVFAAFSAFVVLWTVRVAVKLTPEFVADTTQVYDVTMMMKVVKKKSKLNWTSFWSVVSYVITFTSLAAFYFCVVL